MNKVSDLINRLDELKTDLLQFEDPLLRDARTASKLSKIVTDPAILASMKWLKMTEAIIYSRKSKNTLLKDIMDNKIYGFQEKPNSDWIIDRESIDKLYYSKRDEIRIALSKRREA